MARKRKAGRPKGSKNKSTKMSDSTSAVSSNTTGKRRRGRPAGVKAKRRGRPAGIPAKRRGRPAGSKKIQHSLLSPGPVEGIHFIGKTLIIDTSTMNVNEVVFLGEGKLPKVR